MKERCEALGRATSELAFETLQALKAKGIEPTEVKFKIKLRAVVKKKENKKWDGQR